MKKRLVAALLLVLIAALVLHSYAKAKRSAWNVIKNPETVQMLKGFVAAKKAQAYADTNGVPPEIRAMFKYAERGDWQALSNSVSELKERISYWDSLGYGMPRSNDYRGAVEDLISEVAKKVGSPLPWDYWAPPRLKGTAGETIKEVYGAFDAFVTGDEKYSTEFGREIIDSIPAGSIYFGGSDPGRFIVTTMCKSQPDGNPLFTLGQNSLDDKTCRDYLRSMYGGKIYIPTEADWEKCLKDSLAEIEARRQVSNELVYGLRGPLAKILFDKNPANDFFVEEGFPIEWMYSHLEPHGLIFKINRQPLSELSDEIIQRDRAYWRKSLVPKIGGWLTNETSLAAIAGFAKKVFSQHDLEGFTGDARFVQNEYAGRMFSRERAAIAGLYAWRASHSTNDSEKQRMTREADFAFRQAWALCPYLPEAEYRYVNFLLAQNRFAHAMLVAETTAGLPQVKNDEFTLQLPAQLKQWQKDNPPKPGN